MSGWEAGDLALCVSISPCETCGCTDSGITVGEVYAVTGVRTHYGLLCLYLPTAKFIPHEHWVDDPWYDAGQFRKIRPDEHEACEPEFVTLLRRAKQKEGV